MKLLILLITVFLTACSDNNIDESELVIRKDIHYQINSDKPFTGSVTSYHENGQKKNMGTYKKGLKEGLFEEFFSNGQLLSSVNYFMGGKEGVEKKYYENGQLDIKDNYENGKFKETIVRYDKSGNEILKVFYGEDNRLLSDSEIVIRIGENIIREEKIEGNEIGEILRKSDEQPFNGLIVSYHNGNLFYRGLVRNGLNNGPWETYYESGQLSRKGSVKDGKQNGPWETYFENGELSRKGSNKDGKQDGPHEYYYENRQLRSKAFYKDGEPHGLEQFFYSSGSLLAEECYQNGEKVDLTVCESK